MTCFVLFLLVIRVIHFDSLVLFTINLSMDCSAIISLEVISYYTHDSTPRTRIRDIRDRWNFTL